MQKLYKIQDIAEWLNLPVDRCYTLAREGTIPSVRINRSLRFSPEAISDFIANGGKKQPKV